MATIKQYARSLWDTQTVTARKLGVDVRLVSAETRVTVLSTDIMLAGLIKVLTDKGVVTDAELQSVFTAIRNATLPAQPEAVPAPSEGTDPPAVDLGGDTTP